MYVDTSLDFAEAYYSRSSFNLFGCLFSDPTELRDYFLHVKVTGFPRKGIQKVFLVIQHLNPCLSTVLRFHVLQASYLKHEIGILSIKEKSGPFFIKLYTFN